MGAKSAADGVPVEGFWLFQAVFAGAAATIVAGAVAERMKFIAYLLYSFLLTAFIYPVVGHWVWGGGWLAQLNFHDFAGSTVVHGVGGVSALVGAWMLGPRLGRFNKDGSANPIGWHNLPIVTIGVFILWFGWYGFNAGSTLGTSDPETIARIAINTTLAPSMAAIIAMVTAWVRFGKPDLTIAEWFIGGFGWHHGAMRCGRRGSSILIGAVAGVLVVYGITWLNRLKIDDPVGAIPVHGLCGAWGTLAVGLFGKVSLGAPSNGLFFGGGLGQLGVQSIGVVSCLGGFDRNDQTASRIGLTQKELNWIH